MLRFSRKRIENTDIPRIELTRYAEPGVWLAYLQGRPGRTRLESDDSIRTISINEFREYEFGEETLIPPHNAATIWSEFQ